MTQKIINTGIADKGNGDPIRTAFTKVNDNFAELYSQLATSVVVGATAPTGPEEGSLWWNSESGRMYVYFGTAWVDASPVDGVGISSTNQLVNGGNTVSLGSDAAGSLTLPNGASIASFGGATTLYSAPNRLQLNVASNYWKFDPDGKLTFPNGSTIGDGDAVFGVPITTARGTILIGNSPEPGQADHFHIMKAGQQDLDLFLGDDSNYVKLPSTGGVEISSYDIIGGQQVWRFGTDGALTLPDASVITSYKPVTVIAATTTTQTITDNASAAFIQFIDTVDTASAFSTGTFTAPYTGYYQINMSVHFSTVAELNSGSFLLIDTNLDNTKLVTIFNGVWLGKDLHYSTVIPATAGDAVRIAIRQVSGADIDIASGSRLTIHRVSID